MATNQALFHFYEVLNDFLPETKRDSTFEYTFDGNPSIKHLIEALGIPHTEIHRILVNGNPVDFTYLVQNGDRISAYPAASNTNTQTPGIPSLPPNGEVSFVVDNHLGKLAAYLRMLGFDAIYRNDFEDKQLAQIASQDNRILLTRDRRLLMRSVVQYGYWVRATEPRKQISEILRRYDLIGNIHPFQRCLRCNGQLEPVAKSQILDRLEPLTKKYYDEFKICQSCGQIYWKGSHFQRMQKFIEQILQEKTFN
jgi:uncharacterized protein with PIN domain